MMDGLSSTFAALGDPTRRSILERLTRGPATVGELAAPFRMTQQAISKHLAYLERARLIEKRREGRTNVCALRAAPIREVRDWTLDYHKFWEESFDRLDEYLREVQAERKSQGQAARKNQKLDG